MQLQLSPVTLIGWSYGAAVCLSAAVNHPQLVNKLVVYEPAITSFVQDPVVAERAAQDRLAMTAAAKLEASHGNLESAVRRFMDGVNDQDGTFESLSKHVQEVMIDNARMLPLLFAAPAPRLTCDDLADLEERVVIVVGGETRPFYMIAAEWAVKCAQNARLVTVPTARHLLPVQDSKRFAELVLGLVTR